jgi:hypothetical protein
MLTPEELQYFLVAATVQDILARFKQALNKKMKNFVLRHAKLNLFLRGGCGA